MDKLSRNLGFYVSQLIHIPRAHTLKHTCNNIIMLSLPLSYLPLSLSLPPSPPTPLPPHTRTHTGCDQTQCFSDTWALNLDTNEWLLLVNTSSVTFPYPQARFTTAGGIYPGQNTLWLSMGETSSGRKLSDTWIFRVSFAMDGTNIIFNGKKISSIFVGAGGISCSNFCAYSIIIGHSY